VSAAGTLSRRTFAQRLALFLSGLLAGLRLPGRRAEAEDAAAASGGSGARWGMAIDLDRCTGCGACVVACRTENNIPSLADAPEATGTGIYWMALLEQETPPGRAGDLLPLPCMHCDDPPCVKVCPVNATYRTAEGIVAQVWDRCIGCRYCQVACPYSRRYFNWTEPEWPEDHLSYLNPDVATRPKGVVEKCTFCNHRIRRVKEEARLAEREPEDRELRRLTACAEACPAEAIVFGDLADPQSEVARLSESPRAFRLLEHLGTRPKVTYLSKDRRA
jgi:molybdopterin-containing oxidoreductase family iron-sulfur binding subunit